MLFFAIFANPLSAAVQSKWKHMSQRGSQMHGSCKQQRCKHQSIDVENVDAKNKNVKNAFL